MHTGPAANAGNFGFLAEHDAILVRLAADAEAYAFTDPTAALFKLRQFAECLAQQAAAYCGVFVSREESFADLLRRLQDRGVLSGEMAGLFHAIRKEGNKAVHEFHAGQREALHQLRMARAMGVWLHTAFRDPTFRPGAYVPPASPVDAHAALQAELAQLRAAVAAERARADEQAQHAIAHEAQRREAETAARRATADAEAAFELAEQTAAEKAAMEVAFAAKLGAVQAAAHALPSTAQATLVAHAQAAADQVDLDEASTRKLIDAQLTVAGWQADTTVLNFKSGTRPVKGQNLAIAEWPTTTGPADYVLFAGLIPLAVVEAKRKNKNVSGALTQAERYSRDFKSSPEVVMPGTPWGVFQVPFLFSTNGRPFLRQILQYSGIWFRDARLTTNLPRALESWYTPDGLKGLLKADLPAADASLKTQPVEYPPMRPYQRQAVLAVEAGIAAGRQELLLAMATGTGKTRVALALIYRLLKSGRFRRILFLVDRTSLGEQANDAFKTEHLEQLQTLTQIYDVKGLDEIQPDPDTRLHIATVQGAARRVLAPADDAAAPPVDQYDCIIIDECHRGYNLDRDLSDVELGFRSEDEYISAYRRVLDHFDAVRIGLTATPALHTTQIFGAPVFQYTYRQAVIDGFLVDHEPPVRLITLLNQNGIHWEAGADVTAFNTGTGQLELFNTPDDIDIEVDGFNTQVVTEKFNRVVCSYLAKQFDPTLPGKVMIFCATDAHADLVVHELKVAWAAEYGEVDNNAVRKITGATDKPLQAIRTFKNETLPKVAVTVDLLTTGIDVPAITDLVFIRRVRSRILYEQMLGRATRLCPEIGKECFRIHDAVDLYAALQDHSQMRPVVTQPNLTFAQFLAELTVVTTEEQRALVLQQLGVKLRARLMRLSETQQAQFAQHSGKEASEVLSALDTGDTPGVAALLQKRPAAVEFLDKARGPGGRALLISDHDDALVSVEHGYGTGQKPEDYLQSFGAYLNEHQNELPALLVVTQRPRELTRAQLKDLALALDNAGFGETALRTAWRDKTNQDIAATIIGFIRQQALGSPLVPYGERVETALKRVLARQAWTVAQRDWLKAIGKQLQRETIVDREALDRGEFQATGGGFARIDRVFDGKLGAVLGELADEVWRDVG